MTDDLTREAVARAIEDKMRSLRGIDGCDELADAAIAAYEAVQHAPDASDLERAERFEEHSGVSAWLSPWPNHREAFKKALTAEFTAIRTDARQAAAREMREKCAKIVDHRCWPTDDKIQEAMIQAERAIRGLPDNA